MAENVNIEFDDQTPQLVEVHATVEVSEVVVHAEPVEVQIVEVFVDLNSAQIAIDAAAAAQQALAEIQSIYSSGIISRGTITRVDNVFTFSIGFIWKILTIVYQNTVAVVLTVPAATSGFYRISAAVLTNSNTIILVNGVEDESEAQFPELPPGTILLTYWTVFGEVISEPTEPIVGALYVEKQETVQKIINGAGQISVELTAQETNFFLTNNDLEMIEGTTPSTQYLSLWSRPGKIISFYNKTDNPVTFKHSLEPYNFRCPNNENYIAQPGEYTEFKEVKDDGTVFYRFVNTSRIDYGSSQNLEQTLELGDRGYRQDLATGLTPFLISDRTKVLDNTYGDDHILMASMFRLNDELVIKNSYGMPIKIYGTTDIDTGDFPSINGNAIDETTYIEIPAACKAFLKKYYDEDFIGEFWMMTLQFETVPSSGPSSTDFLPEGSVNKYFTDARALAAVPTATPSIAGKTKLYSNLTGTNTDGAVGQKEVVEKFNAIDSTLAGYNLLLNNNNLRQTTDRSYVYLFDHFLGTGLTNGYAVNNANGGNSSVGENRTGAKGVSVVHTGTSTSTGQGALVIGNTDFPPIIIGQGTFYFRTRVQVPILSDSSQSFYAQEGFLCNGNRINPLGSMMFMYDQSGAFAFGANAGSPNWKCVTTKDVTSRTFSVTSIPVIAGTWYELLIIVNAAGTQVDFYIDGNLQFSHTTNIPTTPCFINHSINKTVGTTRRETVRDWFQFQHS